MKIECKLQLDFPFFPQISDQDSRRVRGYGLLPGVLPPRPDLQEQAADPLAMGGLQGTGQAVQEEPQVALPGPPHKLHQGRMELLQAHHKVRLSVAQVGEPFGNELSYRKQLRNDPLRMNMAHEGSLSVDRSKEKRPPFLLSGLLPVSSANVSTIGWASLSAADPPLCCVTGVRRRGMDRGNIH